MGKHVLGKLTALEVTKAKTPGYLSDGGNLWLRVSPSGSKSWAFIYDVAGRRKQMGLGSLHKVSLEKARQKAADARALLGGDKDPINERHRILDAVALERARRMTFAQAAKRYIAAHSAAWTNAKHTGQWTATLESYAYPKFGHIAVADVDTALVMSVIEPLWLVKNETAMRLRGRIEAILDWAKAHGYRVGENPARFRGHLDKLLAKQSRRDRIEHHPSMNYNDVPAFMAQLKTTEGMAALALRFLILTACRTGEVIGAKWEEIDMKEKLWVVPAERMKAKKEHRVPLSDGAMDILKQLELSREEGAEYVFPGRSGDKPMSNMSMLQLMRRMNLTYVPHGFRGSFRTWAAEKTNFAHEVCEAALAHTIENQTTAAYQTGDLLDKRSKLMNQWDSRLKILATPATVTPINKRKAK